MENASDAIKIAFALFVFVTAITLLFVMTSRTRYTAEQVLSYSDDTNYYRHVASADSNRIVHVPDVIATLYRYYNETIAVEVKLTKNPNPGVYLFDLNNETILDFNSPNTPEKLTNRDEIEQNLGYFIKEILFNDNHVNSTFTEEFMDIPTSGIYLVDDDGTELTLKSGSRTILITYEEI